MFRVALLVVCGLLVCPIVAKDASEIVDQCGHGVTFSRKQAIDCAFNVVDTNNDHKISPAEIDAAKSTYLHWWEKTLAWVVGGAKTSKVMKNCDHNKNGFIEAADFPATQDTCMPYKDKDGKVTGSLCKFHGFCDRAAKALNKKVY